MSEHSAARGLPVAPPARSPRRRAVEDSSPRQPPRRSVATAFPTFILRVVFAEAPGEVRAPCRAGARNLAGCYLLFETP
jgi:hypothetical protein